MGDFDLGVVTRQLCDGAFSSVVESLLEGYIVVGGTATGQAGLLALQGGVDFVWDLWNEQFCAFTYPTQGLSSTSLLGATAAAHVGFGTGRFHNIHDAWSGEFRSVEAGFELHAWRVLGISGAVQYFQSPDGTMRGALGSLGGSATIPNSVTRLFRLPANASITAGTGFWTPSNAITESLAPNNRTAQLMTTAKGRYWEMEVGVLGVGAHILQVLGISPGTVVLAGYATAVALAKDHAESKGIRDRAQALRDLHLTLCSQAYRQISQYKSDVGSGSGQRTYDGYTVQRTSSGNFIITTTNQTATGEWRTTRRLYSPDAAVLGQHRYWMATGGAPNGFINGRSYPMMRFSEEIGRLQDDFLRR